MESNAGFYSQSESIGNISGALLKVQKVMGAAKKESTNPFFKSKYADLGAVLEVCKGPLNDNGIVILQPIISNGDGVSVLTTLLHESGEFISSKLRIAVKQEHDPQAQGSAITYARRYALLSILSIPTEDDDAEGAMQRNRAPQKPVEVYAKPRGALPDEEPPSDAIEPEVVDEVDAALFPPTPKESGPKITDAQGKRLYAIWKAAKKEDTVVKAWLLNQYGYASSRDILLSDYEKICKEVVKL